MVHSNEVFSAMSWIVKKNKANNGIGRMFRLAWVRVAASTRQKISMLVRLAHLKLHSLIHLL